MEYQRDLHKEYREPSCMAPPSSPRGCWVVMVILTVFLGSQVHCVDVIVVGAGLSGLSAARRLVNHGGFDVKVLEARADRYGGRVWTDRLSLLNTPLDLGATWIHGASAENPLSELAREAKLALFSTDTVKGIRWNPITGEPYPDDTFLQRGVEFIDMMFSVAEMAKIWDEDRSLTQALETTNFTPAMKDPLMLMFTSAIVVTGTGASMHNISAKYLDAGKSFEGPEQVLPNGFFQIAERLKKGNSEEKAIDVTLGKAVTKVQISESAVHVSTVSGDTYRADVILVTVPLGVLKSESIEFDPPLAEYKKKAIKQLGFGVYNKVAVQFDEAFWDLDKHFFGVAPVNDSQVGMLNNWYNLHLTTKSPVLVGHLGGDRAAEVERWTDQQLKHKVFEVLSDMFGKETMEKRRIVSMVRTRWQSDPFSRGSYSYYPVGSSPDDRFAIQESTLPHMFFAGEHTDVDYFGSAHGAYFSGQRAAYEIIDTWYTEPNRSPNNETESEAEVEHTIVSDIITTTASDIAMTTTEDKNYQPHNNNKKNTASTLKQDITFVVTFISIIMCMQL